QLPGMWVKFTEDVPSAKLLASFGQTPRARARAFVHNSLVDGAFFGNTVFGPAMAGAIAWLFSTMEQIPVQLSDYPTIGYDLPCAPGPPEQKTMYNFRAVMQHQAAPPEDLLGLARSVSTPEWRPPPH